MKPDLDAAHINYLVNHPDVYPWIKGSYIGKIDLSQVIANDNNIVLTFEYGGMLFIKLQAGLYELHTSFLKEGRNKDGKYWAQEAIDWVFINTDACEIVTRCPKHNPASSAGAIVMGFSLDFTTGKIWPANGEMVAMDVFSMKIEDWVKKSPFVLKTGDKFHHDLHDQYDNLGYVIAVHDEDEQHDRYAGACVSMIRSGMIDKGINFYNRWSSLSSYEQIGVESYDPLIIDIKESRILIKDESFEVL